MNIFLDGYLISFAMPASTVVMIFMLCGADLGVSIKWEPKIEITLNNPKNDAWNQIESLS
jgi:hypothetical protein